MSFPDFFIISWLNNNTLTLLEKNKYRQISVKSIQHTWGSNFDVSHIINPDVPSLNTTPIPFNNGENSICLA
jgi:hypothetical protein